MQRFYASPSGSNPLDCDERKCSAGLMQVFLLRNLAFFLQCWTMREIYLWEVEYPTKCPSKNESVTCLLLWMNQNSWKCLWHSSDLSKNENMLVFLYSPLKSCLLSIYFSIALATSHPHLKVWKATYSTNICFVTPNYKYLDHLVILVGTRFSIWSIYICACVVRFASRILI